MLKIKQYFENKRIEKVKTNISDIKVKDIILKSNKEYIISDTLKYFKENKEIIEFIKEFDRWSIDGYVFKIEDSKYLSKIYDYIYSLSLKENGTKNKNTENYFICDSITDFSGNIIDVRNIYTKQTSYIDEFKLNYWTETIYGFNNITKPWDLQFFINLKIEKTFLKTNNIAALILIQIAMIKDSNEFDLFSMLDDVHKEQKETEDKIKKIEELKSVI